jgi:hypothetical protein
MLFVKKCMLEMLAHIKQNSYWMSHIVNDIFKVKSYVKWLDEFKIEFDVNGKKMKGGYIDLCYANQMVCYEYNTQKMYYDYKDQKKYEMYLVCIMCALSSIACVVLANEGVKTNFHFFAIGMMTISVVIMYFGMCVTSLVFIPNDYLLM